MARAVVVGASRGLGRALIEGLRSDGHDVLGISRRRPDGFDVSEWIEADLTDPVTAANSIDQELVGGVDTLICNVGIWEGDAFTSDYVFTDQSDVEMLEMINANVTGTILLLKRLIPRMIDRPRPRIILTGSTSGLPRSGRPEVAFGASKSAINGIADAVREGYRKDRLAVTVLHLGYLNTEDGLDVPRDIAAARGEGSLVPVHDVVDTVRSISSLSSSTSVWEVVLTAIDDPRF